MEWISVKDKLPEIGQTVVCWLDRQQEPVCCKFDIDGKGPIWKELVDWDIGIDREDRVSHWISIPNPPDKNSSL